jgi:predicted GTPase
MQDAQAQVAARSGGNASRDQDRRGTITLDTRAMILIVLLSGGTGAGTSITLPGLFGRSSSATAEYVAEKIADVQQRLSRIEGALGIHEQIRRPLAPGTRRE